MSKTMSRALFALSGAVLVMSLSACDGIGSGNRLVSMHIIPGEVATLGSLESIRQTYTDVSANECVRRPIALIGQFSQSDNSLGTFTERARWTSSNTAVARVSNSGEEAVPGGSGSFFAAGTITPVGAGTATITATYLDFVSTIQVTVKPIVDVRIEPADARLATSSSQIYRLTAELEGVRTDIAAANTLLSFDAGSDTVAVVSSTASNTVVARNPGGPLNLNFELPACNRNVSTTVRVADMQSLVLQHEDGFSGDLVVGNNEIVRVFADFGSGPEQDLTAIANASLVDAAANARLQYAMPLATAIAAGNPVAISATCCVADRNGDGDATDAGETATFTSNELQITPVAGTLTSISISPLNPSIQQRGAQVFTALGSFDSGARIQPVTRQVSWTSSDASVASIAAGSSIAISSLEVAEPKTTTVTATPVFTGSTAPAVTTTLTVTPLVAP